MPRYGSPTSIDDPAFARAGRALARDSQLDARANTADDYAQELRVVWWRCNQSHPDHRAYADQALRRQFCSLQRYAIYARRLAAQVEAQSNSEIVPSCAEAALECHRLAHRLPEEQQHILLTVAEETWANVAAQMGVSIATAKRRHAAALQSALAITGGTP